MDLDFTQVFLNDLDWTLAAEIVLRTVVMFTVILVFLRLSGKKGVRQLSLFEVAIVIGMGSAAGDPMLSREHAIFPALVVFGSILLFYRCVTWAAARSERFERIVEGDPVYIIEDGEFVLSQVNQHAYAKDEFFSEMRQQSIEHVGQVRTAVLETNGNVSFLFFEPSATRPGLPVWPAPYQKRSVLLKADGQYACTTCAHVERIDTPTRACGRCGQNEWVAAIASERQA